MSELSFPWGGIILGDAVQAPYTDDAWSDLWRLVFTTDRTVEGVIRSYLNTLQVSGTSSPLNVATGAAVVDGKIYINSGAVALAVSTPGGATRLDYVVLRKDWAAQTVRITLIAGVEGGGAPALTQVDGTTWDIPLALLSTTVGGVITVTDERNYANTPLSLPISETISEPMYPESSRVPMSGIVSAGISQVESSGAGTAKPTFFILTMLASGGESGRHWEFICKTTPVTPKVEVHYYMGSANTAKHVVLKVYVACVSDGDASVTAKVFDTANSFTILVPDAIGTEGVATLSLTNFDGMQKGDRVIIALDRDEASGSDDAAGNFNYVKGRFLYV